MNHPELLPKLNVVQAELWTSVTDHISEATGRAVSINSPLVLECLVEEALQEFAAPAALVQFTFAGQRDSTQQLILPLDTAHALYAAFIDAEAELNEETVSNLEPLLEAFVQGICLGLGNVHNAVVVATDLSVRLGRFSRPGALQPTDGLVRVQLALAVESSIGSLTWLMDSPTAHYVAALDQPVSVSGPNFGALPTFGSSRDMDESHGLDILMDVPLDISVELGRTRLVVKEVVDLGIGSIVEIDKAAGEPVDVLVNGRLVARGEVVVIEYNFGVRITEILTPRERIARLGEAA